MPTPTPTPRLPVPRTTRCTAVLFLLAASCHGYHRAPCRKVSVRRQFQFSDCYVPNLNPDIYLNQASFLMAHDAATGYLNVNNQNDDDGSGQNAGSSQYSSEYDGVDNMNGAEYRNNNNNYNDASHPSRWNTITTKLLSLYGKTQVGTVYEQLNDGARALDLRPKIYSNNTVGFHHGSLIDVPLSSITLGGLLEDAKQWCNDNPKELVILFHSELVHEAGYNGLSSQVYLEVEVDDDGYGAAEYDDEGNADDEGNVYDDAGRDDGWEADESEDAGNDDGGEKRYEYQYYYSGIAKLKEVYQAKGVPYFPCEKVAGLTVGQAMEMADLSQYGGKGYLIAVDRHDMYGECAAAGAEVSAGGGTTARGTVEFCKVSYLFMLGPTPK